MIKQLKDKKFNQYFIKIYTLNEYFRDGNLYYYGDNVKWCCDINSSIKTTSFCSNSEEEMWKNIIKEMNLEYRKRSIFHRIINLFRK